VGKGASLVLLAFFISCIGISIPFYKALIIYADKHMFYREIINCLKFDCSKKLVNTIFQLLDTIQANVTFLSTGQIRFIFWDQLDSSSFTFRQKNINCLNLN
jgi:hypothetical protein